jgi:hypothetical protein
MPTVAREGGVQFVVHTRDHEPPHVHVRLPDDKEVRINLNDGSFMDPVPKGKEKAIKQAYRRHAEAIREAWEEYHAS